MNNFIATQHFLNEIQKMRQAIHENLLSLMEKHKAREVDCLDFNDCPVVIFGNSGELMTLDSIEVITTPSVKCIHFNCSDSQINDYTTPHSMQIELLIRVYEWVVKNEEYLFNQNEDE